MICIRPCAPAGETAVGSKFDSTPRQRIDQRGIDAKPAVRVQLRHRNVQARRTGCRAWSGSTPRVVRRNRQARPARRPASAHCDSAGSFLHRRPQAAQFRFGAVRLADLQQGEGALPAGRCRRWRPHRPARACRARLARADIEAEHALGRSARRSVALSRRGAMQPDVRRLPGRCCRLARARPEGAGAADRRRGHGARAAASK